MIVSVSVGCLCKNLGDQLVLAIDFIDVVN